MAQENKLIRWANDRFPPIDLNNEVKPLIELIGKVKELEERNKVLEDALRTIYNIENAAFNLSNFDVTRLKKEIEEALLNNHK